MSRAVVTLTCDAIQYMVYMCGGIAASPCSKNKCKGYAAALGQHILGNQQVSIVHG